jgi:hypothetical protein
MNAKKRIAIALTLPAFALSGCYVVPVAPDGTPIWPAPAVAPQPGTASPTVPAVMQARLYPANDVASRTGALSGTVTNMMTG